MGFVFIAVLAMGVVRSAAAEGTATAEAAPSWPRLPDGRVVIEIYGRRLAFPPDRPPGQAGFQHGNRDVPLRENVLQTSGLPCVWRKFRRECAAR